jgi:hypothetical protein
MIDRENGLVGTKENEMLSRKTGFFLIVSLVVFMAGPLFAAQTGRPPSPVGNPGFPGPIAPPPMPAMPTSPSMGFSTERLDSLKTALNITDVQLPLWENLIDVLRANEQAKSEASKALTSTQGKAKDNGPTFVTKNLFDDLALKEKMMFVNYDNLQRLKPVLEQLYTSFSDEQKKTADQRLLMDLML